MEQTKERVAAATKMRPPLSRTFIILIGVIGLLVGVPVGGIIGHTVGYAEAIGSIATNPASYSFEATVVRIDTGVKSSLQLGELVQVTLTTSEVRIMQADGGMVLCRDDLAISEAYTPAAAASTFCGPSVHVVRVPPVG